MNTRIQELVEKATSIVESVNSQGYTSSYAKFDREKFAELIVQECAQIADKAWAAPGYQIKQHFGVTQ